MRDRFLAVVEAVGLTAVGIGGFFAIGLSFSLLTKFTSLSFSGLELLLWSKRFQLGFLLVALVYMHLRDDCSYARFRRPNLREAGWIMAVFPLLIISGEVTSFIVSEFGLSLSTGGSSAGPVATPSILLLPVMLVIYFLVAAPSEELLFRGVIQGRLREVFDPKTAIVFASVLFALMHVPMDLFMGRGSTAVINSILEAFVGGLVFGLAYERTGNLTVPSVAHATIWAVPILFYFI